MTKTDETIALTNREKLQMLVDEMTADQTEKVKEAYEYLHSEEAQIFFKKIDEFALFTVPGSIFDSMFKNFGQVVSSMNVILGQSINKPDEQTMQVIIPIEEPITEELVEN